MSHFCQAASVFRAAFFIMKEFRGDPFASSGGMMVDALSSKNVSSQLLRSSSNSDAAPQKGSEPTASRLDDGPAHIENASSNNTQDLFSDQNLTIDVCSPPNLSPGKTKSSQLQGILDDALSTQSDDSTFGSEEQAEADGILSTIYGMGQSLANGVYDAAVSLASEVSEIAGEVYESVSGVVMNLVDLVSDPNTFRLELQGLNASLVGATPNDAKGIFAKLSALFTAASQSGLSNPFEELKGHAFNIYLGLQDVARDAFGLSIADFADFGDALLKMVSGSNLFDILGESAEAFTTGKVRLSEEGSKKLHEAVLNLTNSELQVEAHELESMQKAAEAVIPNAIATQLEKDTGIQTHFGSNGTKSYTDALGQPVSSEVAAQHEMILTPVTRVDPKSRIATLKILRTDEATVEAVRAGKAEIAHNDAHGVIHDAKLRLVRGLDGKDAVEVEVRIDSQASEDDVRDTVSTLQIVDENGDPVNASADALMVSQMVQSFIQTMQTLNSINEFLVESAEKTRERAKADAEAHVEQSIEHKRIAHEDVEARAEERNRYEEAIAQEALSENIEAKNASRQIEERQEIVTSSSLGKSEVRQRDGTLVDTVDS